MILGLIKFNFNLILLSALGLITLLTVHMIKLFWGCNTTLSELAKTAWYSALVPIYSFFYLLKGLIKNKPSIGEVLFLLRF
jgi:hypothetical protein